LVQQGCGLVPFTVTPVLGYEIKKLAPLREVARKDGNRQDLVGKSVPEATNSTWGYDGVKFQRPAEEIVIELQGLMLHI
jgi:hypothetical protein